MADNAAANLPDGDAPSAGPEAPPTTPENGAAASSPTDHSTPPVDSDRLADGRAPSSTGDAADHDASKPADADPAAAPAPADPEPATDGSPAPDSAIEPAASPAPRQAEAPPTTPKRNRKGKPVMPSWDEVLLGVRSQR